MIILGAIKLKTSNWKFFVGIGILLIIIGFVVLPDDGIIGVIGIIIGGTNIIKGLRLYRGIQPLMIRKQEEREQALKDEVQDKINEANDQNKD